VAGSVYAAFLNVMVLTTTTVDGGDRPLGTPWPAGEREA